jgi:hypothetical protein
MSRHACRIACFALSATLVACTGSSDARVGPTPRASDPLLSHSWTMPASAGPVAQVDLGTHPTLLADEMMERAEIAGVVHRIATRCDALDALPRPGEVALRFTLVADDAEIVLGEVEADPAAAAGRCLTEALQAESAPLKSLSAGAALIRLRLHPPATASQVQ